MTEKATALSANLNQYIFSADRKATKRNIKDAVEEDGVTVLKVNTFYLKPKSKRDRMRRNKLGHTAHVKAIVKLSQVTQ